MAILARPRLHSQQRLDLEDLRSLLSALRTDSHFQTEQFISKGNLILKGFIVTGVGSSSAIMDVTNGTLINPESTGDFSWYSSEEGAPAVTIPASDLTNNTRNYIELQINTEENTPVTKAFWDPAALNGEGAEFQQEVNTVTDLKLDVVVLTGGFSGLPDRLPICFIDTDASGEIKAIRDKRNLMFRLGSPSNPQKEFSWTSKVEPATTLTLTGVAGLFEDGETITFSTGATATVVTGGNVNITCKVFSNDGFLTGDTVTGSDSGAFGTLNTIEDAFIGADKDIDDYREMFEALMTEVKRMKGTDFWFEDANIDLNTIYDILSAPAYEEPLVVVSGAPSNDNEITGPISAGTTITLPPHSRTGATSPFEYEVGRGGLEVYLNTQDLFTYQNNGWSEVGTSGDPSDEITINQDLEVGDVLVFRLDSSAGPGGLGSGSGGGTSATGANVGVGQGEVYKQTVADTLEFKRLQEGSNVIINDTGDEIVISAVLSVSTTNAVAVELRNKSGITLNALSPVRVDTLGGISNIDVSQEDEAEASIGILVGSTPNGSVGQVVSHGIINNITTTANFGDVLYIDKSGNYTDTKPSIGVGGFIAGDFIVRLGVILENKDNPGQKDLLVQVNNRGQL